MKIQLISVGKNMPQWVAQGYQEYAKRLPREYGMQLIEIPMQKRTSNANIAQLTQKEGEEILMHINAQHFVIALDIRGQMWETPALAQQLYKWQHTGKDICFIIGGPDGLAPSCLARAQQRWSLSHLTFPHPLVRVIVIEQLYRAWSILAGHPYHRG